MLGRMSPRRRIGLLIGLGIALMSLIGWGISWVESQDCQSRYGDSLTRQEYARIFFAGDPDDCLKHYGR